MLAWVSDPARADESMTTVLPLGTHAPVIDPLELCQISASVGDSVPAMATVVAPATKAKSDRKR